MTTYHVAFLTTKNSNAIESIKAYLAINKIAYKLLDFDDSYSLRLYDESKVEDIKGFLTHLCKVIPNFNYEL